MRQPERPRRYGCDQGGRLVYADNTVERLFVENGGYLRCCIFGVTEIKL